MVEFTAALEDSGRHARESAELVAIRIAHVGEIQWPGLGVARVASLERETGQMFARITTQPLAGVDRSEYLLVLGHASALPARPDEPADTDDAKKTGKGRRRGG